MLTPYYADSAVTLYHGDCREIVPQLGRFDLLLTDPPYGMNYNTDGSRFTLGGRSHPPVYGDDAPFDVSPWLVYPHVILWGFNHFPRGLPPGGALVWVKRTEAAFGQFLTDAEIAWNSNGRGVYCFTETRHAIACKREHPTEKPVELMRWCIHLAGDVQTILDPFAGSGTTGRAAKDLGRKCTMIEREERYCEVIARRMGQEVLPL